MGILLGSSFLIFQIFSSLRGFNWSILSPSVFKSALLALGLSIFATVLQMTAWKLILEGIGHNISIIDVFSGFSLSFVARYIPGTVWGYLARGEWLKRDHKVPYSLTNIGSIVETIGIVFANLLVVIQGLLLSRSFYLSLLFGIVFLIGSWAFLNLIILWKPTRRLFRLENNNILKFPFLKWALVFILFIGMWCCYGSGLLVFAKAIDFQVTITFFLGINSIYALAWFLGFIVPFLPSGLGLREYSLTILLIAQFGLVKSDASFIAIGFRVLVSIAEFLWILFGLTKKSLIRLDILLTRK